MTEQELALCLLGASPAIQAIRRLIVKTARTTLPVLIQGPTGAGKEVVAQALHAVSERQGPIVAVNVCAIPETMFESALFGHVRGAFTGALRDTPGFLTEARRGTLFLDEIATLSLTNQAKLLRAIERQEYRPLGSRADCRSEFRVLAASNCDLPALAEQGLFRADLIHRLSGVVILIPSLVERLEDIRLLVDHFIRDIARQTGKVVVLDERAMGVLEKHSWPGNVRELRLTIERAVLLAETQHVGPGELAALIQQPRATRTTRLTVDPVERGDMLRMLDEAGWDTAALAARLGTHRATVYRWMRRLEIHPRPLTPFRQAKL